MQTKVEVVYETLNGFTEVPGLQLEMVPALLPATGSIIEHQDIRYKVLRWWYKASKGIVVKIQIQTEQLP